MDKPRAARPTIKFIDEYCASYKICFQTEAFKHLHVGMISRLSVRLTRNCQSDGLENEQSLHHFLTKSPGQPRELRKQRLSLIFQGLKGEKFSDY